MHHELKQPFLVLWLWKDTMLYVDEKLCAWFRMKIVQNQNTYERKYAISSTDRCVPLAHPTRRIQNCVSEYSRHAFHHRKILTLGFYHSKNIHVTLFIMKKYSHHEHHRKVHDLCYIARVRHVAHAWVSNGVCVVFQILFLTRITFTFLLTWSLFHRRPFHLPNPSTIVSNKFKFHWNFKIQP